VGETFFQMMLKSMRNTHGKPAYMHGGQAEEIFQGQLDQEVAGNLAQTAGGSFSNDLFQLFRQQMQHPAVQTGVRRGQEAEGTEESVVVPVGELRKS
jgi:Rod binding domain-containing protein